MVSGRSLPKSPRGTRREDLDTHYEWQRKEYGGYGLWETSPVNPTSKGGGNTLELDRSSPGLVVRSPSDHLRVLSRASGILIFLGTGPVLMYRVPSFLLETV